MGTRLVEQRCTCKDSSTRRGPKDEGHKENCGRRLRIMMPFDTADAIRIPFLKFKLIPENSQGREQPGQDRICAVQPSKAMGRPADCQQIITDRSTKQTIHVGAISATSPRAPQLGLSCSHMGCDLAAVEISDTESSCAIHGELHNADAIRIPFMNFNLIPENSQGRTTSLRCAAFRSEVLPWLCSGMMVAFMNGMRLASTVSKDHVWRS